MRKMDDGTCVLFTIKSDRETFSAEAIDNFPY